jgi:hypothetical protein
MVFIFFNKKLKNLQGWNPVIAGFISGLAIIFETEGKAAIISMLMAPRLLETLWNFLVKRGVMPQNMPVGAILLYGAVMGLLNYFYQNNEGAINPAYLKVFKKIWGVN